MCVSYFIRFSKEFSKAVVPIQIPANNVQMFQLLIT